MSRYTTTLLLGVFLLARGDGFGGPASGAHLVASRRLDLGAGVLTIPSGYKLQRGGIDSVAGDIRRLDGDFIVEFDIGHMAGYRMRHSRAEECLHYVEIEINGSYCSIGLLTNENGRRIEATFADLPIRLQLLLRLEKEARRSGASEETVRSLQSQSDIVSSMFTQPHQDQRPGDAPANFWADIRSDADLIDFLLIIGGYHADLSSTGEKGAGREGENEHAPEKP